MRPDAEPLSEGGRADLADDGEFEERIAAIHIELAGLNEETTALAATIQGNLRNLGCKL